MTGSAENWGHKIMKRYWKFYVKNNDGKGFYLEEENPFVGTDDEAADEATLRSDAYENETGRTIDNVILESHGFYLETE
jgi:hypothetical protein